ncbi:MAG: hypothetical protein HQL63_07105 [Magnetococcales bacterium]|nr:hypothetical protein [Magnetococcales bacterium]
MNQGILAELRRSLTRQRRLEERAAIRIRDHMRVDQPLDALVSNRIARLEPYEVELLLASLFTPDNHDRKPFEAVLPLAGLAESTLAGMTETLSQENPQCTVEFAGDSCLLDVPGMIIERYVRLLHLNLPITERVAHRVRQTFPEADQLHALCCVRQPVWQGENRESLLLEILDLLHNSTDDKIRRLDFLGEFVGSYRPLDLVQLTWQLIHLVESYQSTDLGPVFNPELENLQVNPVRSRYCGPQVKEARLSMAHSLLRELKVIMKID